MQLGGGGDGGGGGGGGGGGVRTPPVFVNVRALAQLWASQLLILTIAAVATGGGTVDLIANAVTLDQPLAVALGALSSLPLLWVNRQLEESESSLFAELNLSTNMFVYSIFGLRRQALISAAVSVFNCLVVGTVEETVFRGQMLPAISNFVSSVDPSLAPIQCSVVAALISSVAFAAGHLNLRGGLASLQEQSTQVLFCVQLLAGLSFATAFLLTGSLTSAIVAHALYDFVVMFGTHLKTSGQYAYAMQAAKSKSDADDPLRLVFFLMDKDRDGLVSRRELRIGLYSFGLVLPPKMSGRVLGAADTDRSGKLDFAEFAEFVKNGKGEVSNTMKRSLLGMRV